MNFAITAPAGQSVIVTSTPASTAEHRKLTDAAQQFEGMLLQEMLKPMKEHGFCQEDGQSDGESKDAGSGFGDTLNSYGADSLATAIAKSGGLGIAKRVVEQVEGEKILHQQGLDGLSSSVIPK